MSKQAYIIKLTRTSDGFQAIANGKVLDFKKIEQIVSTLHDELIELPVSNQSQTANMTERRLAVFQNDALKGTSGYKGSSKLSKEWGVSVGTIIYDRKQNELHPPIESVTETQEPVVPEEPVIEPSPEPESEPEKKSKKNGKGKKGKK
ncbi:MAG: hypothetical protein FIB07_17980 [Candidatus Methanoperedens sp.]|nr:hypothetical protein [Candidatus Methanoperedens sp.]